MKKVIVIVGILVAICGLALGIGYMNSKEKVVIYSCMEEEREQSLKKMVKEKFPNINVAVQHIATGNLSAKIKTEGTNMEADIVLDLETTYMEELKDNFANLSSFDKSNFVDNAIESDNYFPWTKYTTALIIDKKYLESHNLNEPSKYEDLLKPEYKNLIAMPDPKTSGTGYAFLLNAVNVMGEDKAIEYFKQLKNNVREFTLSGSGPTNLLKQGEVAIAMGMTFQGVQCINDGNDFKIICLNTGAPYNTTSFGIIRGKENNSNVIDIFKWLNSEFIKYDKEYFVPDKILKEQENKVKNYPTDFVDGDMKGLQSVEIKNTLLQKWSKING